MIRAEHYATIRWHWGRDGKPDHYTVEAASLEQGHPDNEFTDLEKAVARARDCGLEPDVAFTPLANEKGGVWCPNNRVHDYGSPKVAVYLIDRLVWYPGTDPLNPLCPRCKKEAEL